MRAIFILFAVTSLMSSAWADSLSPTELSKLACWSAKGFEAEDWCRQLGYEVAAKESDRQVKMAITHVQSEFPATALIVDEVKQLVTRFRKHNLPVAHLIFPGWGVSDVNLSGWQIPAEANDSIYLSAAGESPAYAANSVMIVGGYWANCHGGSIQNFLSKANSRHPLKIDVIATTVYAQDVDPGSKPETLLEQIQRKGIDAVTNTFIEFLQNSTARDRLDLKSTSIAIYWDNQLLRSVGSGPELGQVFLWSDVSHFDKKEWTEFSKL